MHGYTRFAILLSAALATSSFAADITPLNCDKVAFFQRETCWMLEAKLVQDAPRIYGRPVPSTEVVRLPAHGTAEAKKLGYACLAGTAMRRLPNGWEQLRNRSHQHLRCDSH
jgi:hypothetical protein